MPGGRGPLARHPVVVGQLGLREHRPDAGAGQVLGQLAEEQHPGGGAHRQRAAEVAQQRPPGQHARHQPEQAVRERADRRGRGDLVEQRPHLVPPARQGQAERGQHGGGEHHPRDPQHGRTLPPVAMPRRR